MLRRMTGVVLFGLLALAWPPQPGAAQATVVYPNAALYPQLPAYSPQLPSYTAPLSTQPPAYSLPPAYITANPYVGQRINPYDSRVNAYSPQGALNRYTTQGGRIYAQDGTYLGRLNANRYDPQSVANPYGPYGSPYSSTSINNPNGPYGSPYSSLSARNPYTTTPPIVVWPNPWHRH